MSPIGILMCSYSWIDSDTIVANVIPEGRGAPPVRPLAPIGPRIEDNSQGKLSQARTYQDLLKDTHDEDLFDYFCTSELVSITVRPPHCSCTHLYQMQAIPKRKEHVLEFLLGACSRSSLALFVCVPTRERPRLSHRLCLSYSSETDCAMHVRSQI